MLASGGWILAVTAKRVTKEHVSGTCRCDVVCSCFFIFDGAFRQPKSAKRSRKTRNEEPQSNKSLAG